MAITSNDELSNDELSKRAMAWFQHLPAHDKLRVAVERSRLSDYRNRASGRVRRNRRFDIGIGLHRKRRLHAVERDAGGSSQAVAQDEDALADWAATGAVSTRG